MLFSLERWGTVAQKPVCNICPAGIMKYYESFSIVLQEIPVYMYSKTIWGKMIVYVFVGVFQPFCVTYGQCTQTVRNTI